MQNRQQKINEAVQYIQNKVGITPSIGLILGSGLGVLADEIEGAVALDYHEIPHFPTSTVEGHAGRFVFGTLQGKRVAAMQGRFHYYEGYGMSEVTFPLYVLKRLGIETIIITNAAGGMNRSFAAGDLMVITDHINLTGDNPLIGPNLAEFGARFPDMSQAYDKKLSALALLKAKEQGISIQQGVYAGISGPAYMTPSELTMLARVGGDAVGMSTVPEVIVARHCGLKILGISCITDMAIGEELEPLSHEQVVEMANKTRPQFISLMNAVIAEIQ
ncbi:purine-nucleoside phosphorylase [Ammoniphilus sp. YIM 78166]|uniref:purine-nucleoside phosphorylase n=1 Tax=Ammoniphilus sp. YIM 78166 TaxID=1644106 RepID=UPI00106FA995|nr:purine-nucleoside phosphorylase [Ammoniphilus sp. YIM 78166]